IRPSAAIIAKLGLALYQQHQSVPAELALPVYLRNNAWKTLAEQQKT
ncbi:tRNA (adenosine(37)-N6)-threonylcarbamoyltransferase complex dimerization subunit type 1 TsaB, partial [Salmonella enterica subsp. enterica serovar Enteritidis]|nr:tRNA (adenosine(37)-N6)-threonylcarbamoyltransferase complex dimerization subunit type 1 TsaB [Salmonella enterica subsp. enterica serovar Enteritidis]